jgi:hypothetical protein
MPKIEFDDPVKAIQGKIFEDMVIKRYPNGKLVISKRPNMTKVRWSKAQKANRQHFKLAIAYAKAALADPVVRAKYEKMAKKQHRDAWHVAVSDYRNGNDLFSSKKKTNSRKEKA